MRTNLLTGLLVTALALGNAGCLKKIVLEGTIKSTRLAAGAADTIGDYELARGAASGGLVQFEGMHRLAPDNEDALFLLTKSWTGYGYAFVQDEYEIATLAGDEATADYHKKRAKLAFDRGIFYGLELLAKRDEGFKGAKRNADTMRKWLTDNFDSAEDAETLFWVGAGWMARVNLLKEEPEYVADLFVGVAMLERSREIDPTLVAWAATSTLAAYHARASMAELDEAKKLFDLAIEKTQRKSLSILLNYATRYACNKGDQALYEKMINEVLNTEDPEPKLRLQNTIAKRRAKRALTKTAMQDCGFTGPTKVALPASK